MANRDKASALKALAKRPALVSAIEKGNKKIKQLRDTVEKTGVTSSGGFIRSLVWATICILDDNKFVKFAKTFKKSHLEDFEKPTVSGKPKKKEEKRPLKEGKNNPLKERGNKDMESPRGKFKAGKEKEGKEGKKEKTTVTVQKPSKVEKSGLVKLIRPIGDIPANHPVLAEYYDGFWHIKGKHIAIGNMQFIETKIKPVKKANKK